MLSEDFNLEKKYIIIEEMNENNKSHIDKHNCEFFIFSVLFLSILITSIKLFYKKSPTTGLPFNYFISAFLSFFSILIFSLWVFFCFIWRCEVISRWCSISNWLFDEQ